MLTAVPNKSIEQNQNSTVLIETDKAYGSGVVIADGYVLTAAHVTSYATKISIQFRDGRTAVAIEVGRDEHRDLTLLRVDTTGYEPVQTYCDMPELGQTTYTVGMGLSYMYSTYYGRVMLHENNIRKPESEQIEATILASTYSINETAYPGNSGGGVFDLESGALLGIVSMTGINTPPLPIPLVLRMPITYAVKPPVICGYLDNNKVDH